MPFQPQALSERTLKNFVDTLVHLRKKGGSEEGSEKSRSTRPVRTQCQEEVAQMLGFDNWHAAISSVRNRSTESKDGEASQQGQMKDQDTPPAPDFWRYPTPPAVFDEVAVHAFLKWAAAQDIRQVSTGLGSGSALSVGHPSFNGHSKVATDNILGPEDIALFLRAVGAASVLDYGKIGSADAFVTINDDRWEIGARKGSHFLMSRRSKGDQFFPVMEELVAQALPSALAPSPNGAFVVATPTWLTMQTLSEAIGKRFFLQGARSAAGELDLLIKSHMVHIEEKAGVGVYGHDRSTPQSYMDANDVREMKGKPGALLLYRCNDGTSVKMASSCGRDRPVYLGFCPGPGDLDDRFQRVSDTLIAAFELFDQNQWQKHALEWVRRVRAVSVYLPLESGWLSSVRYGVFETLVLNRPVMTALRDIIQQYDRPQDARPALARLVLERGQGFMESLATLTAEVPSEKREKLAQTEEAWRQRWLPSPSRRLRSSVK